MRLIVLDAGESQEIEFRDTRYRPSDPDSLMLTAPFTDVIFRRGKQKPANKPSWNGGGGEGRGASVRLKLLNPRVRGGDVVAVVGSTGALGEWDSARAAIMDSSLFPLWTLDLPVGTGDKPFAYQYLIKDGAGAVVAYEDGPERGFEPPGLGNAAGLSRRIVVTDNKFRYKRKWRGAGVAVPVFSLRSERGFGVGEFLDLMDLIDWASASGLQVIQMLPVNDTTTSMGRMDSVPYSCISVFALHPLYLNLEAIGSLPEGLPDEIERHRTRLNGFPRVAYEEVITLKVSLLRRIFEAKKDAFLASQELQGFLEEHGYCLRPYAAFSALRDHFRTSDFQQWGPFSRVTEADVETLTSPGSDHFETVAFYFFLQYHLHLQLSEVARYASENGGVGLKGDIPIGIRKQSDYAG